MEVIDSQSRIKYYLGELSNMNQVKLKDTLSIKELNVMKNNHFHTRIFPLIELLKKNNYSSRQFKCNFHDISSKINDYCFVKNRSILDNKPIILRCINTDRHWKNYYCKPKDIAYLQKKSILFWRGTTTGNKDNKGNRFDLIKKWYNKKKQIDIGFSHICQGKNDYERYVKGKCNIDTFLKYKYILSVEGNDKDSGIQWKLNSNSLVFMAKPTKFSWLMEDKLIPNYHYILVKDDFSDIFEKYQWCEANTESCLQIIKNANLYMSMFSDIQKEEWIEKQVLKEYFQRVST
jgi:hypothetical protein